MSEPTNPAPLFLKLDCYSLPVPDLDAAIAFYGKLGHALLWREGDHAAGLRLPQSDSEIVLHTDKRPFETCLLVGSVPDAIARLTAAGARLEKGPFAIGVGSYALLRDPWDNPLPVLDFSKGTFTTDAAGNVTGNRKTE